MPSLCHVVASAVIISFDSIKRLDDSSADEKQFMSSDETLHLSLAAIFEISKNPSDVLQRATIVAEGLSPFRLAMMFD